MELIIYMILKCLLANITLTERDTITKYLSIHNARFKSTSIKHLIGKSWIYIYIYIYIYMSLKNSTNSHLAIINLFQLAKRNQLLQIAITQLREKNGLLFEKKTTTTKNKKTWARS